jgi:rhodanese-related sulfurtransferase
MSSPNLISPDTLMRLIGTPKGSALLDVRLDEDFAAVQWLIPGALWRDHATVSEWTAQFAGRAAVAIRPKGRTASQGVAAWLRQPGGSADVLEGGHLAGVKAGIPVIPEATPPPRGREGRAVWVTQGDKEDDSR